MTDKVQKIRAEIIRRYNEYMAKDSELAAIRADECLGILSYIDSMQEEPTTSVWHDANILPSNPKAVIVEHNEYSTSICRAEQMSRIKGAKWAYVEDLLKL